MPLEIIEGWTDPIRMTLKSDGVERDITGASLELRLWNNVHAEVLESGAINVLVAVSGLIDFSPGAIDFQRALSPYYARVQVTDVAGDVSWHPSAEVDVWTVRGVGP